MKHKVREIFSDNILSALSHQNRVCTFIETEYELIIENLYTFELGIDGIETKISSSSSLFWIIYLEAEHWFDFEKKTIIHSVNNQLFGQALIV